MDDEQKLRAAYICATFAVAASLVYVVWAFVQHPWEDTALMLEFEMQREQLQKMKAESMVICPANSYCVASARYPFMSPGTCNNGGFVYGRSG